MTRPTPKPPVDLALALSAARDAVGDPAAVQRVRAGVLSKIASGAEPPASVSAAGAWLGKSVSVLLLAAGATALLYNAEPPPPAASAARQSAAVVQTPAPAPAELVPELAPPTTPELSTPHALTRKHHVAAPRANPSLQPKAAAAAAVPAPCADADIEVGLLSRAQQALRSQPRAALALLNEHAQRFSCGVLGLERDSLRIDAERALGLDAQAAQHARELVARYPESQEARALRKRSDDAANSGSDHKNQPVGLPTP